MGLGPTPKALPLWEEFSLCFFARREQLEGLLAVTDISDRLAEISGACSPDFPELASLLANLAALDATSLPGDAPTGTCVTRPDPLFAFRFN